ncbi:MAG: osmotically inducible protein C [Deltaproteobacteria bacterium]|nr:MAG: osmotically inducible protein C [Deltaproteobacteria bacterium]
MRYVDTSFVNEAGQELRGRLDLPVDGRPLAYALFAHCFTCGKDIRAVRRISECLTGAGIAVLRFDFTGLGQSEGDFADTSFSSNVDDLVAAAEFLRREHQAPQLLIGHSLGGAAVLMAASRIPESRAVVTLGAPASPANVKKLLTCSIDEIEERGEADVSIAGRSFVIKKQFLDDLDAHATRERVRRLKRPLLILHSPIDEVVGVDNASELFLAARHPKSFVSLDQANHLMSRDRDSRFAGGVIAAWALPLLNLAEYDSPLGEEKVFVRTEDTYLTAVRTANHGFVLDEPKTVGGTDLGADPYAHLLAALGACTSITLRMYADRKGFPVDAINVRLSHNKIHARDCEECEPDTGRIDVIDRVIEIEGPDLTDEARDRMLAIADRCPVHGTLTTKTIVRTTHGPQTAQ